jgi:WD40 repeat protein
MGLVHYVENETEYCIASSKNFNLSAYNMKNYTKINLKINVNVGNIQLKNQYLFGTSKTNQIVIMKINSINSIVPIKTTISLFDINGLDKIFDISSNLFSVFGPYKMQNNMMCTEDYRKKSKLINFHKKKIRAIRCNQKTRKIFSGGWDSNILIVCPFTHKLISQIKKFHSLYIYDFELSKCKRFLITGGHDSKFYIFDCFTFKCLKNLTLPYLISNIKVNFANTHCYVAMWQHKELHKESLLDIK